MYRNRATGHALLCSGPRRTPSLWWLSLATLLALAPIAKAVVPFERWQCGSEEVSKRYAHEAIHARCPEYAGALNHCCVVHDDCYVRQLGQWKCDDDFKKCNDDALTNEPEPKDCKKTTDLAALALSFLGFYAYQGSVNYTEPDDSLLQLCHEDSSVGMAFDYLYLTCPTVKPIVSSCCHQLQFCPKSSLGRSMTECAQSVSMCLERASAIEQMDKCTKAVNSTRRFITQYYSELFTRPQLFTESNNAFLLLILLSIVCAVGLLLTTLKYYRLRAATRANKYSRVQSDKTIIDLAPIV